MQVTQEKRSGSQVGLTIEIESERVEKAYEKTLRYFVKNIQLQGFRKGKAPRRLVLQYLGPAYVKAVALEELVNDTVEEAIKDADIEAIGQFQIEGGLDSLLETFNPKSELSFSGTVDVQPQASVSKYTELDISVPYKPFDPAKVDETIDYYRQQRATLLPVEDRPAKLGDTAVMDFVGRTLDGEEIEGATAEEFQVELEESKFIPGFISGIVGMEIDETREVDAEFPEDYTNEDVAGQKAKFTVTLKELKMKELPPVDDELAQSISEFESLDALRAHLTESFQRESDREAFEQRDEALVSAILEHTEVELPDTLVNREIEFLINQSLQQLSQQGLDASKFMNDELKAEMQERSRPDAIARLQRTMALAEIVRLEKMEVGETELAVKVEDFLKSYGDNKKISLQRVQEYFREELLTEKVFEWLKTKNTVTWVDDDEKPVDGPDPTSDQTESEDSVAAIAADAVVDVDATAEEALDESGKESDDSE